MPRPVRFENDEHEGTVPPCPTSYISAPPTPYLAALKVQDERNHTHLPKRTRKWPLMSIYDMSTSPEVPSFDSSASASNSAATAVIISSVIICNGRPCDANGEARAASHHRQKESEDSGSTNELKRARPYDTEHAPRN